MADGVAHRLRHDPQQVLLVPGVDVCRRVHLGNDLDVVAVRHVVRDPLQDDGKWFVVPVGERRDGAASFVDRPAGGGADALGDDEVPGRAASRCACAQM